MNYLNAHSRFSPMGGMNSPIELLSRAQDYGATALALTDTNGLYGIPEFLNEAKNFNVRPVVGSEVRTPRFRFTVLIGTRKGYETVCLFLSQLSQKKELKLQEAAALLKASLEDLTFFSCDKAFLLEARKRGANAYFEMSRGFFNHKDVVWARSQNIPLLANNKIHYIEKEKAPFFQVLRAIDENLALDQVDVSDYHNIYCHMSPPEELKSFFAPYPDALKNNQELVQSLNSDWFFQEAVSPGFNGLEEKECDQILKQRCLQKIFSRYDKNDRELIKRVKARLESELEVISLKRFSSYFLNVTDMANQCEYTCGRGSSAASIVNYLLHITHVDPISENLLFERFMNIDRQDPPDIDVDFPWDERDDVLDYIFKKHEGRAAMVANHNFLRERSALRETAKVFGIKEDEISYTLERLETSLKKSELSGLWKKVFQAAAQVEGTLRNLSVHCGGVVVTPDRIDKYVPVETSKKGYPVIQWEKDQTEMAGLIKTDILGNRGLAVIRDVINSLRLEGQADLDYQKIDAQSDLKTKELFIKGETVGVLHFESPRCRSLLGAMQSAKLSALSIVCSIIRPAALNQVNELLRRFRGGRFHWIHPKLKDILKSSYGVMVYQEDVMRVTRALAGFSNQEGNELRKVLAKKSKDKKLQYYRDKFFNGCAKEGLLPAQTQKLWEDIESFAGYSFCKPHSDSYSLVAFKSAYLKAHYPAHFFAAVISNQGGFYVGNVEDYLNEARRAGVAVLSPDVNLSHYEYSAVHSRSHRRGRGHGHMEIRTGLKQLKGVSSKTLKKIISYRESGPYKDLEDFLNRVNPPFHEARILAKARCFGSLRKVDERKLKNSEIMWMIYEWRAKREGSLDPRQKLPILLTDIKEHPKEKLIYWEREFLNGFVTFPSWFLYRDLLKRPHITPSSSIKNGDEKNWGREIILYGQKVSVKSVKTKHFEKMAFITFSDDCGMYNATFFPREYEEFRDLLRLEGSFLIKGKVEKDLNDWQIIVSDIQRVGEI